MMGGVECYMCVLEKTTKELDAALLQVEAMRKELEATADWLTVQDSISAQKIAAEIRDVLRDTLKQTHESGKG
jgi:hypothetical protein